MSLSAVTRLARMDRQQAAFRLRGEIRNAFERTRAAISTPRWDRTQLAADMRELQGDSEWTLARSAIQRKDFRTAHLALARYFSNRRSAFPLDAMESSSRAAIIQQTFPRATADAVERGDALVRGEYDLLGYRAIRVGPVIDWHADPVNGRRSPMVHSSALRYLDPGHGDHKVIWEFNRHQHWLALGRAYALTRDPKYYDVYRSQFESWMTSNPPTIGINWASMLELGFRTISWLWAIGFFSTAAVDDGADEPWLVDALLGITRQLRHIERNLSLYFSPNTHLSGEALALYVAGCALPELRSSSHWKAVGREVLLREAHAQILNDGGHAELSGHYHRYSTDFYLLGFTVARDAGDPAASSLEEAARKQARYLRTIADDKGLRPATGDDDGGQLFPICGRRPDDCADTLAIAAVLLRDPELAVSPAPEEAYWWCGTEATQLDGPQDDRPWRSMPLEDSGYYVSRNARGDHLLFDAGRHGFLNGGHAHSDALAIVLTVANRPLLVDPGTATYTMDAELRDRFRSTAMHNTLMLDGRPQSEPSGPFHWRSRANGRARVWRSVTGPEGVDYMEAGHDGYGPRQHVRSILAVHGIGWWILDTVVGIGHADAVTHWHLHPSWQAIARDGHVRLTHRDGHALALSTPDNVVVVPPGTAPVAFWSPEYGRVEPAPTIAVTSGATLPHSLGAFIPSQPAFANGLRVRRLRVDDVPDGWIGGGWQATWEGGEMSIIVAVSASEKGDQPSSWPPQFWGLPALATDGRVAAIVRAPGRNCAVLIDGRELRTDGTEVIAAQLPFNIVRRSLTNMAPLVHEHEVEMPVR